MKIYFKSAFIFICSLAALSAGGCVSSGTYQAKEQESLELKKTLHETKGDFSGLQEKNKKLAEDNGALLQKLEKISVDFAAIKADNEKLKRENESLATAVKPENLLKSLVASFTALQAENVKLKQAVAAAPAAAATKAADPPVQLSPAVMKPTAGVDTMESPQSENAAELTKESVDSSENLLKKPAVESK